MVDGKIIGIDVSTWQGTIDWDKVKKAGIDFAIIRCGWGTTGVDNQFHRNMKEARRVGIKVGVYLYSYAHGVAEAQAEAKHCLDLVREYGKLDMPIYYDEEEAYQYSRAKELAIAFCTVIESAGYWAGVYSSSSKWQGPLKGMDNYTKWVANWGNNTRPAHNAGKPNVSGCDLHQYSSVGNVSGISGDVDMNELYRTSLFDDIAGKGCYERFINLLKEISDLEKEYTLKSLWKKRLLIKIKDKSKEIMQIINMFNENVNFR